MTAATGYVSAQVASRSASQTVDDTVTFRVRIQNISSDGDAPTLFAPGAWALHSNADPLFTNGEADRGEGLESLAEDGDPAKLVETLLAKGLTAGNFNTPVCADSPRPLQTGEFYEFEVTASPETPYLSFATMLVQSNDLFLAPSVNGIALFDEDGKAIGAQDVTDQLLMWDTGTEANEEPGAGPNQAPRQSGPNAGPADEIATVRPVDDGFSYPDVADLVTVYIYRSQWSNVIGDGSQPPIQNIQLERTFKLETCNGAFSLRRVSAMNSVQTTTGGQRTSVSSKCVFIS